MTCPKCVPLCVTTEAMLANRIKNMGDVPSVTVSPCPHCGGTDWATTRERIKEETVPVRERWWWRLPSSRAIIILLSVAGAAAFAAGAWNGPSWLGMFDMLCAGFNFAGAIYFAFYARLKKSFDSVVELNRVMHEMNHALLENKVASHMMGIQPGEVPTRPKLH